MLVNIDPKFKELCIAIYSGADGSYVSHLIAEARAAALLRGVELDLDSYHPNYLLQPAVFAVLGNNLDALRCLRANGATFINHESHNLLEWALSHPYISPSPEMLAYLTSSEIVAAYNDNTSTLHVAAVTGNIEAVEECLSTASLTNIFSNSQGLTAINWAVLAKQQAIVEILTTFVLGSPATRFDGLQAALTSNPALNREEVMSQLFRNYLCALISKAHELFEQIVSLSDTEWRCLLIADLTSMENETLQAVYAEKEKLLSILIDMLCNALRYYSNISNKQPNDHKEYIAVLKLLAYCLAKIPTINDMSLEYNIQLASDLLLTLNQVVKAGNLNASTIELQINLPTTLFLHASDWERRYATAAFFSCEEKIQFFLNRFAISKQSAVNAIGLTYNHDEVPAVTSAIGPSIANATSSFFRNTQRRALPSSDLLDDYCPTPKRS